MRYIGWTIFLVGTGLFVVLGDMTVFTMEGKIGVSIMCLGMIMTSASTILEGLKKMRERKERIEALEEERKAPSQDPTP